jgi:hypothetical protein
VPSPSSGSGDKLENGSDPYSDEFDEIYPEFLLIYNYAIFFLILNAIIREFQQLKKITKLN